MMQTEMILEQPVSAWAKFYAGRSGPDYQSYVEERYAPFINAIIDRVQWSDTVLEIGAGTATITNAIITKRKINALYMASDSDPEMVNLARQRLLWYPKALVIQHDALWVSTANVVHSHGLLEHFDDDTIRKIIRAHSGAGVQIHYVPGLYDKPSFGDERLMSVDAWWRICQPDQIITFNGGLDYALVFE